MLKLTNVSKYYHSNEVVALGLRKVNLEFKLGEFVAVTGESGSGKSTLLNVISGLDTYEDGEMYINGEETSYFSIEEWENFRRQYIGFVFQNYNIIDSYSVLENVMIALIIQGYDPATRRARALELIDKVGLSTHIHHKASKLSGGQKQRCVIARALAKDCPIIVADEPTGNLDSETGKHIMSLLEEVSKDKLVIVVTHNYDQVKAYATRKIRLFDGEVVEDKAVKKTKEVTKELVVPSFTMSMLNLLGISVRNLFRTPRRTIFTSIVSFFTVLIFVFSYGAYVKGTSDSGNFYGGGYFNNVTESRIIVTKFDNTPFTPTEIDELENIDLVRTLLEHDVVLDLTIFSYEKEYDWIYNREQFVNPAAMLTKTDLLEGELPTSKYEVVIEEIEGYNIGDTILLGYNYGYDKSNIADIEGTTEFTITGIMEKANVYSWRGNMYFHDDYLEDSEVILNAYLKGSYYMPPLSVRLLSDDMDLFYMYDGGVKIDDTIPDNEVHISIHVLPQMLEALGYSYDDTVEDIDHIVVQLLGETAFESHGFDVKVTDTYEPSEGRWSSIAMNSNMFDQLMTDEIYQVAVLVYDTYDAEQVIDDIDALGYNTIYPDGVTDPWSAMSAIFTSIWLGVIMGFLFVIMYLVTYLVFRNVQNSKKKDYLILRSIGASKRDMNRVTIIELLVTTTIGYTITMGLFVFNELYKSFIPRYARYFTAKSYITIFTLMIVLAVLLGITFNRRIFSKSVITSLKQE